MDTFVDAFLSDLAKICIYDLPLGGDSMNFAIVKKSSPSNACQFEIRYFGFDFSSKCRPISIPKKEKPSFSPPNQKRIARVLYMVLDRTLGEELSDAYIPETLHFSPKYESFTKNLVDKYTQEILKRIEELKLSMIK